MRIAALAAFGAAFAAAASVSGCGLFARHGPPPEPHPVYVVGEPYQAGGVWRYPRAQFAYSESGLAAVAPDREGALTADGEAFDQTSLAAGHRTLQLPAVARVTNLDNGLSLVLRINDRGPASPARLVELTRRTALLLQAADGSRVRVDVLEGESRRLAAELGGEGPHLDLATAPRTSVAAESLPPPPGVVASRRGASALAAPEKADLSASETGASGIPLRMPEQLTQGPVFGGSLFVDCGSFSRLEYARLLQSRLAGLGAAVATRYDAPRDRAYDVRIGPLSSVAQADATVERAIRSGATDARIIVGP